VRILTRPHRERVRCEGMDVMNDCLSASCRAVGRWEAVREKVGRGEYSMWVG
jgi:hypothetical protein